MAGGDHGHEGGMRAERRHRVLALRDADGLTFREIAAQVGVDVRTAYRDYQRAITETVRLTPEEQERARERKDGQLLRIDEQRRDVEMQREFVMEVLTRDKRTVILPSGKVIPGVDDDPTLLAAVDRLVKLNELKVRLDDQEAKLLGLYAEQKLALSGGVRYELVGVDPAELT